MADVITDLLDMMRVRSTAYVGKNISAPWNVRIEEQFDLARFHLVLAGGTWIGIEGSFEGEKLNPGDMVIVPNGKSHYYFDQQGRDLTTEGLIPSVDRAPYFQKFDKDSSDTHLLCGYFKISENTPPAITSRLPDLMMERSGQGNRAKKFDLIVQLISEEVAKQSEPLQTVLNRLTEILCLYAIHSWLERAMTKDEQLRALADPKTKLVLDQIHSNPTAPWTVNNLARLSGQSRTAFAEHFKFATGQAPINYVRQWRIKLACKMLEDTGLSIDEIAFKSGYADTNAFNRAFKRETGSSPGAYKRMSRL